MGAEDWLLGYVAYEVGAARWEEIARTVREQGYATDDIRADIVDLCADLAERADRHSPTSTPEPQTGTPAQTRETGGAS